MIPKGYAIILKDNNGNFVNYLDNKTSKLDWEWNRVGGCGGCNLTINENWDSVLAGSFAEDYEVDIYVPEVSGSSVLWYSGFIDRVSPTINAKEESISLFCLGYINQIKRAIVRDFTYRGAELSAIAKHIIDTYVVPITKVTSAATNYEDTKFSADVLYFNESAYDAICKLAEIAGRVEWGVKADKSFFFKKRDDLIKHWFNITEDFTSFTPQKDFNSMITRIYLIGGEGYSERFTVTNRISTREEIVSNSSIITQSVGQQFARMYLKKNGMVQRSFSANLAKQNTRLETIVPIGKAAVFTRVGIKNRYDDGSLYDNNIKYDGGLESYQIEKIRYTLQDDGLEVSINFGISLPDLADDLAKLEYMINTERNRI